MINQENESFNNLNVNNNNNNNTNNNQTENDSTKPSIYWNEQNEEAFLQEIELQNLFANTLLNDDFTDETDFNCLGIDNLQLNLNTNESSNEQQHQQHQSNQALNNDNSNIISNLSLISLSTQSTNNSQSNDYLLDSNVTFNSFDLNNVTNLITSEQILINDLNPLNSLNQENNSNFNNNNKNFSNNENDTNQSESSNQNLTNNQDDNLFKKPNLFDTFFDDQSNKSSSSSSSTLIDSKLITKIKQNKKINYLEPIDLISHFKKLNNYPSYKTQDEIKLKSINDSVKKEEKNDQSSSSSSSMYMTSKQTNGNNNNICNADNNNGSSTINKIFTLKRSRKRSKLLNTNKINQTTLSTSNQDSITITSQTKINNKLAKLNNSLTTANKAITKKEKKEKLKQNKINSNFEPLNKKFAGDSSTANATSTESIILAYNKPEQNILLINKPNNNSQTKTKKEEVELHIKELSLLDLHSSEDDSAELLIKNSITGKLKKNLRSSSNDKNNLNNTISFSNKNNNYLNEIISKRIKYSPALSNNTLKTNEESNEQESFENNKKEHRIDKLIQFLTKSSLDSNANSISSSTSSNESLQLKIINNQQDTNRNSSILIINDLNSSFDLNLVSNENNNSTIPPTSSYFVNSLNSNQQQNKRKKNENDTSYTNAKNEEIISCSLPSANTLNENQLVENKQTQNSSELSKSLTIDNDTLQHMKNLDLSEGLSQRSYKMNDVVDLNLNLKNIEKSILNDDLKSKEKNFKKNKKNSHSTNLESTRQLDKNINSHQTSNLTIDLNDSSSRKNLWNLLKSNSSVEEMVEEFGSELHDKISFWDLVNLKLKFSKNSQLKTTYEIIDDYTILYSNMSTLLESFVEEHSTNKTTIPLKKSENSSRSRSSSRNCRKQTTSLHRT